MVHHELRTQVRLPLEEKKFITCLPTYVKKRMSLLLDYIEIERCSFNHKQVKFLLMIVFFIWLRYVTYTALQ